MRLSLPRFRTLAIAGFLLIGVQTVAACNAVLGIERADLDESFGVHECTNRKAPPKTDCPPASDSCQVQCDSTDCLADHECRASLWEYRHCLGSACSDPNGECLGCVSDNPKALKLVNCLEDRGCSAAPPVSMCHLYCSCMQAQCPDNAPDAANGLNGCLAACTSGASSAWRAAKVSDDPTIKFSWSEPLPSWRAYCLWEHCELAYKPEFNHHCDHAIGKLFWCENQPEADPTAPDCPPGQGRANAPCNTDSDCCSKKCDLEILACTAP